MIDPRFSIIVWDHYLRNNWQRWLYMELCTHRRLNETGRSITISMKTMAERYVSQNGGNLCYARQQLGKARDAIQEAGLISTRRIHSLKHVGGRSFSCYSYEIFLMDWNKQKRTLEKNTMSLGDYYMHRNEIRNRKVPQESPAHDQVI